MAKRKIKKATRKRPVRKTVKKRAKKPVKEKGIFAPYTEAGERLIWLGIAIVALWAILYITLILIGFEGRLYPTGLFLAFGVMCIFFGMMQKESPVRKKKMHIGGMEELGIVLISLELIGAVLIGSVIMPRALEHPALMSFVAALIVPIIITIVTLYTYYQKHKGIDFELIQYDKLLLLISFLSHFGWASMLSSIA